MPPGSPPRDLAGAPPGSLDPALDLSVVVPAYNEAARIAEPLERVARHLAARHPRSEIVVVDDGSTDDTVGVVERLRPALGLPVTILRSRENRGKGHAVRTGMLAARGALVLMTDADLSTPIDELEKLVAALRGGVEIAIGSRKMEGAVIEEHQPILREAMGRVFTWLTRLLVVDVSDVTCGFKLFRHDAAQAVFSRVTLDDWSFDAEALFLARHLRIGLVEVPVRWRDAAGTKVRRGRDAMRAAVGLGHILWNRATGRYAAGRRGTLAGAAAPAPEDAAARLRRDTSG
jgi:glycosyltransferase involved in cell wall biosynthesis